MTDEQKMLELLKALAEVIAEKNNTIWLKDMQIERLKAELSKAEQEQSTEAKNELI